jgi:hypothetical protein
MIPHKEDEIFESFERYLSNEKKPKKEKVKNINLIS